MEKIGEYLKIIRVLITNTFIRISKQQRNQNEVKVPKKTI
jgi:hypothetical protein